MNIEDNPELIVRMAACTLLYGKEETERRIARAVKEWKAENKKEPFILTSQIEELREELKHYDIDCLPEARLIFRQIVGRWLESIGVTVYQDE